MKKKLESLPHSDSDALVMGHSLRLRWVSGLKLTLLLFAARSCAAAPEPVDAYLRDGRLQAGLSAYAAAADNPGRFSLAVLQVLDGVQHFSAGLNHLGINPTFVQRGIPFFRIAFGGSTAVPKQPATPEAVGQMFKDFKASLYRANQTLSSMNDGEFKVEINLSQIHLDLDGDGQCAPDERLLASTGRVLGLGDWGQAGPDLIIHFDSADAMWLKGYTHFLLGALDLFMAYDWSPVWDQCAHLIFLNPEPMPAIAKLSQPDAQFAYWADLIAAIHDMRLPLVDKEGPRRARDEFKQMIACSRICWQRVLAETDDDHEWLPSPRQTGPRGAKISQAQVDGWLRVLDELDAVASGRKLLPHWRLKPGTGVDIEKLVNSPTSLDLVRLIQGSALVPYVESGSVSDVSTWQQLAQPFGPGFAQFAIWSN